MPKNSTPESLVAQELKGSFSILAQKGLAIFARTPVLNGFYLPAQDMKAGKWAKAPFVVSTREGWPDYTGVVRRAEDGAGIFVAVETKAPGGKLRPAQKEMKEWIESCGGVWITAKSRHDFERIAWPIAGLPIPKRAEDFVREGGPIPF